MAYFIELLQRLNELMRANLLERYLALKDPQYTLAVIINMMQMLFLYTTWRNEGITVHSREL